MSYIGNAKYLNFNSDLKDSISFDEAAFDKVGSSGNRIRVLLSDSEFTVKKNFQLQASDELILCAYSNTTVTITGSGTISGTGTIKARSLG